MTTIRNGVSIPGIGLYSVGARTTLVIFALLFCACNRTAPRASDPLPQRGYLWQRDWTAAVDGAVLEAQKRMDAVIVLGAEIRWAAGKPEVVRANINWEMLRSHNVSCGI